MTTAVNIVSSPFSESPHIIFVILDTENNFGRADLNKYTSDVGINIVHCKCMGS